MKDPTVSVTASVPLLAVLHAADAALKASRKKDLPDIGPLHSLIVSIAAARSNAVIRAAEKAAFAVRPEPGPTNDQG